LIHFYKREKFPILWLLFTLCLSDDFTQVT